VAHAELCYFSGMRIAIVSVAAVFLLAPVWASSPLDGKWTAEFQARGKKSKKSADAKASPPAILSLATDGSHITGTVGAGKKAQTIRDGKLDGSNFSFVTVRTGRKGESRLLWTGTLDGDQLLGTRAREGGKRGANFVAKRL
jgi:hypothetical protein